MIMYNKKMSLQISNSKGESATIVRILLGQQFNSELLKTFYTLKL